MKEKTVTYHLESKEIKRLCNSDQRLAVVISHYGDLTYSIDIDPFTHTVENIIGQMLSSKAADAIAARLYTLCGNELTPDSILKHDIPSLRRIGLSGQKSEYIMLLAKHIRENPGFFDSLAQQPDDEVMKHLTALRGIGSWSAKMYLIFVLNRLDVLPFEDGAFQQAYKWLYSTNNVKPESIKAQCAPWSPYSSIASRYMYRALDSGMLHNTQLNRSLNQSEHLPRQGKAGDFPVT